MGQFEREGGASAEVLAGLLLEMGRADEALAVVQDVLPTLEKLVHDDKPDSSQPSQLDSRNYMIRRVWAELLARKGEALAKTSKGADAGKVLLQAVEIIEDHFQAGALLPLRSGPSPDPRLDLARQRGR